MTEVIVDWEKCWQVALDTVRAELAPVSFNVLFDNSRALGFADNCLTLGTANLFVKNYIECNHRATLTAAVCSAFGAEITVKIVVSQELYRERLQQQAEQAENDDVLPAVPLPAPAPQAAPLFCSSGATFANFVTGRGSEFAFAAARRVVQSPGEFSPLVLYGGSGLGKTHLLHAICHEASVLRPQERIICQTAESFVRGFSQAVLDKHLVAFRERYENCALLAIDDFHTFGEGSKLATQKEFTQIMEEILLRHGQVVIATSVDPNNIINLHAPLRSRLRQGLRAQIENLDALTRRAILQQLAGDLAIPAESLDYLANALQGDVREIVGALNKLRLHASIGRSALTPDLLGEVLENSVHSRESLPVDDIMEAVAFVYGVSQANIIGKKRDQSVVQARRAAVHLCRRLTAGSLTEIGEWFGHRTHPTILNLLRQPPFEENNPLQRQKFAAVLARLGVTLRPEDFITRQGRLFD